MPSHAFAEVSSARPDWALAWNPASRIDGPKRHSAGRTLPEDRLLADGSFDRPGDSRPLFLTPDFLAEYATPKSSAAEPTSRSEQARPGVQEFDVELILDRRVFGDSPETRIQLSRGHSLRLGLDDVNGTVEVIGWGIRVPVKDRATLPRLIARRFLALYSAGLERRLSEQEEACLARISEQVDYRAFVEARRRPVYREATFFRRGGNLQLEFLRDRKVKVPSALHGVLADLDDGDRFGAYFATDAKGELVRIENIVLLPSVEERYAEFEAEAGTVSVEFPDSLKKRLPRRTTDPS